MLEEIGGLDYTVLAEAPIPRVKDWLEDAGFDPQAIIEHTLDRPGDPFLSWSNDEDLPPDVARSVRVAMCRQGRHEEERALLESPPMQLHMPEAPGANVTWKVTFENGAVGYAKPFAYLHADLAREYGHEGSPLQPVHEVAAWQLAQRLGEPWSRMVAPCVFREINGHMCSVSAQRFGTEEIPSIDGLDPAESLGFFDSLTGQQDRHFGNALAGASNTQMSAIDHGFAFKRPQDDVNNSRAVEYRIERKPAVTDHESAVARRLGQSPTLLGAELMLESERAEELRARARQLEVGGVVVPSWIPTWARIEYRSRTDILSEGRG